MTEEKIRKTLSEHKLWVESGGEQGARADFSGADLRGADFSGANLRGANLNETCLIGVILRKANLQGADLRETGLYGANLYRADLTGANLYETSLCGANLNEAYLRGADLCEAYLYGARGIALACPEEGSFIAFKKCKNNVIVKLLIPADAKRSSSTGRKCRANKAQVLEISGRWCTEAQSTYDENFIYRVGETVEIDDFDEDRWHECAPGIHFFITREEAEEYFL